MKSAPNPAHVIYAIPSPRKILSQLLQIRNSLRPLSIGCKTNLGDLLQNRLWFTLWHFKSVICGIYRFFFVPCSPCLVPWDKLVSKVQVLSQNHGVAMLLDVKWGTSQYCWNSVRQATEVIRFVMFIRDKRILPVFLTGTGNKLKSMFELERWNWSSICIFSVGLDRLTD